MVKELIKRYPLVPIGAGIYFFLGFTLPVTLIGFWEKFSGDRVPDWLAKRGWTVMGALAAWLGSTLILTVVVVIVLYLFFKYCSPSHKPKTSDDASKVSFELSQLNSAHYADGVQYMLPRFTYNTGVGPSPKIEVKANLTVWDDDSLRLDEYPGVWHLSKIRSKRFSSGDSADLDLGLASDKGMAGYEYNVSKTANGTELSPKLTELNGKQFYVLVIFIGRTEEDVLFEKRQWFGVIAGPKPKFIGLLKPPSHIW